MENQLILYLENTNKEQFENWLTDYAKNVSERVFPYRKDKHFIVSNNPVWQNNSLIIDCTNDAGDYVAIAHENEDGSISQKWFSEYSPLIEFELLALGNRLKIKVHHTEDIRPYPYIVRLLWQLGQDWPETRQIINEHITKSAESHGIKFVEQSTNDAQEKADTIITEEWEKIVSDVDNRIIIRNLREQNPAEEAARRLNLEVKTIYNRETDLRKFYGVECVPYRQAWRKRKR